LNGSTLNSGPNNIGLNSGPNNIGLNDKFAPLNLLILEN